MARPSSPLSGRSVTFGENEVIVSKTDLKGIITYANDVFLRVSGYRESEILGQPHNTIRHPDMPGCIFRLLWQEIQAGREIFAYVNNRAKNGDNYWVFAHVTPSFNGRGQVVGYHSNRRVPFADAMPKVEALYARLLAEERRITNRSQAVQASLEVLEADLRRAGVSYSEFVFSLSMHTQLSATN
jgi:PAS domain S-box-containing protein